MTTAFVLSGGGNMGAVQVGMLAALQERRIVPDLLVGTSVGALNVAYLGDREMTADAIDGLAGLWRRVRRRDAFPVDPLRQMLALTGRRPSLCSSEPLRRLIAGNVGYRRLEDANVPVHLVTAELHFLPPLCPVSVSPLDFTRAGELIGRAYQATSTWLADGGDRLPNPERFLSMHDHGPGHNVAAAQRGEIRHGAYPPGPARIRRPSAGQPDAGGPAAPGPPQAGRRTRTPPR